MPDDDLNRLPRWANRLVLVVLAIAAAGFAVFALIMLVDAIQTGRIESPSRHGNRVASRNANPTEFWLYVGLWSFAICLGISCSVAAGVATFKEYWSEADKR